MCNVTFISEKRIFEVKTDLCVLFFNGNIYMRYCYDGHLERHFYLSIRHDYTGDSGTSLDHTDSQSINDIRIN